MKTGEDGVGDLYSQTAIEPDTCVFLSRHEGGRTVDDAIALFEDGSPTEAWTDKDHPPWKSIRSSKTPPSILLSM